MSIYFLYCLKLERDILLNPCLAAVSGGKLTFGLNPAITKRKLKELRHDILSHFFDGLNYGVSVGKPKNNGLLRKRNTKGVILKQKGARMA